MENKNIFYKILSYMKKLFGIKDEKIKLINENPKISVDKQATNFADQVKVFKEDEEIIALQEKIERNEIKIEDLPSELRNRVEEEYKRQINNLNEKITMQNTQINSLTNALSCYNN